MVNAEIVLLALLVIILIVVMLELSIHNKLLIIVKQQSVFNEVQINNLFRQLECLAGIYIDLKLPSSLPLTRDWAASPDFLWHISKHAMKHNPSVVVECSSGVSTIVLARCMELAGRGHVYSLEHEAEFAEITRKNLAQMGLSDWATVLHAPLRPHLIDNEEWLWYSEEMLPEGIKIDLLVIDGPIGKLRKNARYPAGQLLFDRLSPNATVFLDDASRVDEQEIIKLWKSEYDGMDITSLNTEKGCAVLVNRKQI